MSTCILLEIDFISGTTYKVVELTSGKKTREYLTNWLKLNQYNFDISEILTTEALIQQVHELSIKIIETGRGQSVIVFKNPPSIITN